MPLADNGDIVKALGFVTLYAAYLEEAVDLCTDAAAQTDKERPEKLDKWPTSRKLEYCTEQLERYAAKNADADNFIQDCRECLALLEERNDVVHGRIYAGMGDEPDIRKSGRRGVPDKPIASKELYELANQLFEASTNMTRAGLFTIPRIIKLETLA